MAQCLPAICPGKSVFAAGDDQIEQLGARHQLLSGPAGSAALAHRSPGVLDDVNALGAAVTTGLATDRRGAAVKQSGIGPLLMPRSRPTWMLGRFSRLSS
jgi:hypothetical protein